MKRRDFGALAGSSLAAAAAIRPARAQSAALDPTLLTSTLTPMGAERAGNADGSIPAWTGGVVSPPIPVDQPRAVRLFEDEAPLYTVDASNMAQYQNLLTPATQLQMTKFGLRIKVYPTHRTSAAPQYVYDNTAKNVTSAQFDPRGGRFGFTGAYGGAPFPIINTAEPLVGGAQLIWNHLTNWRGYTAHGLFNAGCVVIDGKLDLVSGAMVRSFLPYYDPNGSAETFDGYLSKAHYYSLAPTQVQGQENIVWHSANVNVHPDIVWQLLNGQGRVRKAPDEAYDTPNPNSNGIANIDESSCFFGNPSQYNWTYIAKQEMLVPYNCNAMGFHSAQELLQPHSPNPDIVRWEKHRVWVVEANLAPGNHNVNAKRRFYIDEDSWLALLGEGYDAEGNMVKAYANYNNCTPSVPGTIAQGTIILDLLSGNYAYNGSVNYGAYADSTFNELMPASAFNPEEMATTASF